MRNSCGIKIHYLGDLKAFSEGGLLGLSGSGECLPNAVERNHNPFVGGSNPSLATKLNPENTSDYAILPRENASNSQFSVVLKCCAFGPNVAPRDPTVIPARLAAQFSFSILQIKPPRMAISHIFGGNDG